MMKLVLTFVSATSKRYRSNTFREQTHISESGALAQLRKRVHIHFACAFFERENTGISMQMWHFGRDILAVKIEKSVT